ncbi:MAG TPA: hypothetical protein IAA38_02250 [Candidatus Ruminococcus gallistercoris]|nr:hypothetical protein [Candidatus Ruminococcus gallistercoris]
MTVASTGVDIGSTTLKNVRHIGGAVDARRFLDDFRQRLEVVLDQEQVERGEHAGEDQREDRVREVQRTEQDVVWHHACAEEHDEHEDVEEELSAFQVWL